MTGNDQNDPLIDPATGQPIDTSPDAVSASDLKTAPIPTLIDPRDVGGAIGQAAGGMLPFGPIAGNALGRIGGSTVDALTEKTPPRPATPTEDGALDLSGAPPTAQTNAPVIAPPPGKSTTSGAAKSTSANTADALKPVDTAAQGEVAAAGGLGTAKTAAAQSKADELASEQAAIEKSNADRAEAAKRAQEAYQRGKAELDRQRQAVIKDEGRGFWSDKSQAAFVATQLMTGIGQFASVLSGTPNQALNVVNQAIDRDAAKKKQLAERQVEALGLKGQALSERLKFATTEIDNQAAGVRESLAAQREARLAKAGVPVEARQNDVVVAGLKKDAAEGHLKTDLALKDHVSQEALRRSEATKNYAEAGKARVEAGLAGQPKESARGINDARQRAMLVQGLSDQDRIVKSLSAKGVTLSNDELQHIQDNRTYLDAVSRGDKGAAGAAETVLLRKFGAVPRNEFDGIEGDKKTLAGALNLMGQKAALLNAGSMSEEAIKHARDTVDILAPNLGNQEVSRRLGYIRTDLIGANQGLVPTSVAQAKAGADAAAAETPRKLSPQEIATLVTALKANPGDPRAPRIRSLLAAQGR